MNFLITPLDGVLTEITNDASGLVDPDATIDLAANLYFGIASTIFVAVVLTIITARLRGGVGPDATTLPAPARGRSWTPTRGPDVYGRGRVRGACATRSEATLAVAHDCGAADGDPGRSPFRDPETDKVIGDSPFMDSLIFIIMLGLLRRRPRLRQRRRHDQIERRRAQDDHEVLSPDWSVCSSFFC